MSPLSSCCSPSDCIAFWSSSGALLGDLRRLLLLLEVLLEQVHDLVLPHLLHADNHFS